MKYMRNNVIRMLKIFLRFAIKALSYTICYIKKLLIFIISKSVYQIF